jgi:hypothetical protein
MSMAAQTGVRLSLEEDRLALTATDGEMAIEVRVQVAGLEAGACVVPAALSTGWDGCAGGGRPARPALRRFPQGGVNCNSLRFPHHRDTGDARSEPTLRMRARSSTAPLGRRSPRSAQNILLWRPVIHAPVEA